VTSRNGIRRFQFPITLAFAMTIEKTRGQTLFPLSASIYDILTVSYISHCSRASKATTVGIKRIMGTDTEVGNEKKTYSGQSPTHGFIVPLPTDCLITDWHGALVTGLHFTSSSRRYNAHPSSVNAFLCFVVSSAILHSLNMFCETPSCLIRPRYYYYMLCYYSSSSWPPY
jgi:hypothetical protein